MKLYYLLLVTGFATSYGADHNIDNCSSTGQICTCFNEGKKGQCKHEKYTSIDGTKATGYHCVCNR